MKKTLLIAAAGMGNRFGGLKQIQPVGPNEEVILHYSIFDAIKNGFNKIVIIVRKENYEVIKEVVGKEIEKICEVHYIFQTNDNIESFVEIPKTRIKPFGIAHAVYCAKDVIKENFGLINADDFYGRDAFKLLSDELNNLEEKEFVSIDYKLKNTINSPEKLNRAKCIVNDQDNIEKILGIFVKKERENYYSCLENNDEYIIEDPNTITSMNMFGFTPYLFEYLEKDIKKFFKYNINELDNIEYSLPKVVNKMINEEAIKVKSIMTDSKWIGITYKEDVDKAKKEIKKLHDNKEYPNKLF